MAGRIRSIKPEILEDEKTAALSHLAWRLFVSLWLIADDYGNLRGDPTYVLGQTLWAAGETRETVAAALGELAGVGLIVRYTVRGQSYAHVAGWAKHQKVTHIGKPRMPGPDEADPEPSCDVETIQESSGTPPETLSPDLRSPIIDLDLESPRAHAIPGSRGGSAAPRPEPAPPPAATPARTYAALDVARLKAIGDLALETWQRVSDLRVKHAAKLKLAGVIPLQTITPGSEVRGFRELRQRIRDEGDGARAVCDHVVQVLDEQATTTKSIEWLDEKTFLDGPWNKSRSTVLKPKKSARPAAPTSEPETGEFAGPDDFAAARASLGFGPAEKSTAELVTMFGDAARAPPASTGPDDTPTDQPRRRKAAT